jgi:hypothetical protein
MGVMVTAFTAVQRPGEGAIGNENSEGSEALVDAVTRATKLALPSPFSQTHALLQDENAKVQFKRERIAADHRLVVTPFNSAKALASTDRDPATN